MYLLTHKLITFSRSASIILLRTMDSSLSSFEIASMIRGYHEYKAIWEDPVNSESLVCEREVGNSHNPLSVAVKNSLAFEPRFL